MKRKWYLAGMCLCLAMSLSACGQQTAEAPVIVEQSPITEREETVPLTETQVTESEDTASGKTGESTVTHQGLVYNFADAKEGAAFIKGNQDYLKGLTQNDLDFRMQKRMQPWRNTLPLPGSR